MSGKVVMISMLIGFITSIVIHHPPGLRCQWDKECVQIKLFE